MAQIGKPRTFSENSYGNVSIARKPPSPNPENSNVSDREKQRLLNNITGYKETDPLYKQADKHNKMGKDEFLKLMTVQLKHQDPMNPMEQNKMAAELAQFSQLEQLSNLNTKFDKMSKNANVQDQFYGASFLGKEVVTSGRSLNFEGEGTSADVLFNLEKPAQKVLVRIFDDKNNMIGEVWKQNIGRGNQSFIWDGESLDGATAKAGEYKTQVFAWDNASESINVEMKVTGTVDSVYFENGETVLQVNGKKVFLRDVDSFHQPGKTSSSTSGAAANIVGPKLPIAQEVKNNVKLKEQQAQAGMNAYRNNSAPSTGITNVYDVE